MLPASADESTDQPVELNTGGSKYDLAAAHTSDSAAQIEEKENANLLKVTEQGYIYFVDEAQDAADESGFSARSVPTGAPIPGNAQDGSRPGAPVTVYLDFDGETLEGRQWNDVAKKDSLVFTPGTVADKDAVWAAVAEDYAPFNVNVTTVDPGADALYKTSPDDNEYGSHVIITDSYDEVLPQAAGSGGIAFLGGAGSEYATGALVFTNNTLGDAKIIAEIASHESGHNFGLDHDGIESEEYFAPQEGVWAPIMGAGYYVPVTQWSAGEYAGATNDEDDLSIISDRSAASARLMSVTLPNGDPYTGTQVCNPGNADPQNPQPGDVFLAVNPDGTCGEQLTLNFDFTDRADRAADTVGDTASTAFALDNSSDSFTVDGVIETTTDVDIYAVTTIGGDLDATVSVADISPNLDAKLTLTNANGTPLAEDNEPATRLTYATAGGLNASISVSDLEAGTYYLSVEGVGSGDGSGATPNNAGGYVEYGSLGNFTLSGSAEAFDTEPILIDNPLDGAAVEGGSEIDVDGSATPEAQVDLSINGAVVDTVTADADGAWAGKATVNQYGNTTIVASQSIDGIAIAGNASVTVVAPPAPVAAPVITSPTEGATVEDTTPTIGGTGVAGATVTITVTDADGNEVFVEALVAADGTWSADVANALADGEYTVVAVQSLNGVTSDNSAAIAFTVKAPAGTGGGGDGTTDDDNNLATTGSDFNVAPFAAMAGVLLLLGGGLAVYARRKRLSAES